MEMKNELIPRELSQSLSEIYLRKVVFTKCKICNCELKSGKIYHYRHFSGWVVPGFDKKQWLFLVCPKCQHQWSLCKLGVDKEYQP